MRGSMYVEFVLNGNEVKGNERVGGMRGKNWIKLKLSLAVSILKFLFLVKKENGHQSVKNY